MRAALVFSAISAVILACGGSSPPPAAPAASTETPTAAPAPGSTNAAGPAQGASGEGAGGKVTAESQREDFMKGCLAKVKAPDYCDCGFEQFKAVFKDADLSKDVAGDDPRMKELGDRTKSQCASKLTEEQVKPLFTKGCLGDDDRKTAYCGCAWTALRKNLAVSDFLLADQESERWMDARKAMAKQCKGKFPADVAKSDFMTGCRKGSDQKVCDCLWKKVSAKFSSEELAAGVADVKSVPGLDACRAAP